MRRQLRRFWADILASWKVMPKHQAIRWYCHILANCCEIFKTGKFYAADRAMRGVALFYLRGTRFEFDLDEFASDGEYPYSFLRELFVRNIYFRPFGPLKLDVCLDLGCNQGIVSAVLQRLSGRGRVIAVDAQDFRAASFRRHGSGLEKIEFRQNLVCGKETCADHARISALCRSLAIDTEYAITIDQLFRQCKIEHVDFLKMDIEGAEFGLFREDDEWLCKIDNIAMEVHRAHGDPTMIAAVLQSKGFSVRCIDNSGSLVAPTHADYMYASRTGSLLEPETLR